MNNIIYECYLSVTCLPKPRRPQATLKSHIDAKVHHGQKYHKEPQQIEIAKLFEQNSESYHSLGKYEKGLEDRGQPLFSLLEPQLLQ